ncbi:efflux RND transporter periplasmic adaptor subunit [uncultured Olegusella sp.]|uniref:efflux RND transporter periplasmic adaptor subunit n=1 Tax=uncultured Olegusella sp. TaxID=1979846 RepID=UPI0026178ED3|nr:biotin/lipoyl-binding protein [uncultured Olegusella sp.]
MDLGKTTNHGLGGFKNLPRKRLAAIVAAAAVFALVVIFFVIRSCASAPGDAVYVQSVANVNIAATDAQVGRYSGVVESAGSQKVSFDNERTLDKVSVKVGDHVKAGQVLFSYDTTSLKLTAEKTQIEIDRLDQTIANSSEQINQLQKQANNSSGDERLDALAQIGQLQADIAQAQYDKKTKTAELERLRASIKDPSVKAEISGTIEKIDMNVISGSDQNNGDATPTADEGNDDNGGSGSANGDSAFITILADGDFRVKTVANEQGIGSISNGMEVIVRSRVDTTQTWKGKVGSIDSKPQTSNENEGMEGGNGGEASKYSFYVNLSVSKGLMLGQHVTVEPDQGQAGNLKGIWIDMGWIVTEGDKSFVWVTDHEGGKLTRREIKIGEKNDELAAVQVREGLSNSDFIAWPADNCKEGAPTTTEMVIPEPGDGQDAGGGSEQGGGQNNPGQNGNGSEEPSVTPYAGSAADGDDK